MLKWACECAYIPEYIYICANILLGLTKCKSIFTFTHICIWEFLVMWMQSKFAYVYFCSLGCCDWCWLQHLLFIVMQLHTWISTQIGDEVYTPKMPTVPKCLLPKCLLWQNVYCGKMSTPKMSTCPKCLLWQNVDSQNVYCLMWIPEGPFGKEISLIHKEFSRHFGVLLKTLQPVLNVYNEFVFWKMYDS